KRFSATCRRESGASTTAMPTTSSGGSGSTGSQFTWSNLLNGQPSAFAPTRVARRWQVRDGPLFAPGLDFGQQPRDTTTRQQAGRREGSLPHELLDGRYGERNDFRNARNVQIDWANRTHVGNLHPREVSTEVHAPGRPVLTKNGRALWPDRARLQDCDPARLAWCRSQRRSKPTP